MIERTTVGEPLEYKGHVIEAKFIGPDLLCHVDGNELGSFYQSVDAVRRAGKRRIDEMEKEG